MLRARHKIPTPAIAILLACACATPSTEAPQLEAGIIGVWRTDGYGHIVEIEEDEARLWEYSAVSCLPGFKMAVEEPDEPDAEAALSFDSGQMRIDLVAGSSADEKWLRPEGTASQRRLLRIDRLPEECVAANAETAIQEERVSSVFVFDVFWQAFREHYPFFELKGVDWQAVRDRERPRVTAETIDRELFGILRGMIEPLEDAHTFLAAPDLELSFGGSRHDPDPLDERGRARAIAVIDQNYLTAPPQSVCNDQIALGSLEGGIRFLRLKSFSNYGSDYRGGLACLEKALDDLLADAESIEGLVIDVRINGGGADPYGLAIASRLATTEYLAYTKETRNDPVDASRWTDGQASFVRPSEAVGYRGPVVLLTSRHSVSAAETFTMALMGRTPKVTRIGEHTQGVFSDVLPRNLPNGWRFGLPNERFLTDDGRSFDGPGIEPELEMPVFAAADLQSGRDPSLERAAEILGRKAGTESQQID